jgi:predicted ArsR family transcriptional regulator
MKTSEIVEKLDRMPLAQCVRELLAEAAPTEIAAQAEQLEKQLEMPMPDMVRGPLREALDALQEARRKATLPAQRELVQAIQTVLRREGLTLKSSVAVADGEAARKPRPRGPRKSLDERREQLLSVMDAEEGMPGKVIAEKTGLSYQTVRRYLETLLESGLVVRDGRGRATTWRAVR